MVLDVDFLKRAKGSAARIVDLERDLIAARADHVHAIRRLHLAGGSLREIAEALGLSHQRVHQLVESGGNGRQGMTRARRTKIKGAAMVCSFCGTDQATARKLIAGASGVVCDHCIPLATAVLSSREAARSNNAFIEYVQTSAKACDFCGKRIGDEGGIGVVEALAMANDRRICGECLEVGHEILEDL